MPLERQSTTALRCRAQWLPLPSMGPARRSLRAAVFLARLAPDGSAGFYSTTPSFSPVSVAVDATGNAVVYACNGTNQAELLRFDSTGAETLSQTIPGAYADHFRT